MISYKLVNERAITGENNLMPVVSIVIKEFPKIFIRLLTNTLIIIQFTHTISVRIKKSVGRETRGRALALKQFQSLIFHAGIYISAMYLVPNGKIIILKTHPIQEELHGNGNGLLVVSNTTDEVFAWIYKRASRASVAVSCTLFLYHAIPCKKVYVCYFNPYLGNIFFATKRISVRDLSTNLI